MSEINLLPQELTPSGYAIKAAKPLKRVAVLSVVILFLVLIGYTVANVYFSIQDRILTTKEENLKKEIKALQDTEQKLVLIEDRLQGIEKVVANDSAREEVETFETIIEKNPQNITIEGAKMDTKQLIISIKADNSANLTGFYSLLLNSNFNQISLDSFNFNSSSGYSVDIAISK